MIPKTYRVAASCFEPEEGSTLDQRRDALRVHITQLLDEGRPDLLLLPETVIATGIGPEERRGAEPVDGPTVSLASEVAAQANANICIPIVEDDDGVLYNTAVYIDRSGGVAGLYRKIVPTTGELDQGIRPGTAGQAPVVLDGLHLGTAICFDLNFPDQAWHWISAGIDLLVFPSYTYAGELMRHWAMACGVPLVCAFPWESVVYDRDGTVLAVAGTEISTLRLGFHPPWIVCSVDFRSRIYHLDFNQDRLKELLARHGADVDVQLMVREGRMRIRAVSDDVDLDRLEQDLGLVPVQKYLRDSRTRADEM